MIACWSWRAALRRARLTARPAAHVRVSARPAIVAGVPAYQRIFVVTTAATGAELQRTRDDLGRDPVVLTAPTPEAAPVVDALGGAPQAEVLLAPVRFPQVDRGHQVDELVRAHALTDRFRDVVVVTDPATSVLLLRALAPDQLASGGAVTVVGLARADRPVAVPRAIVTGLVLGAFVGLLPYAVTLALPVVVALVGLALLLVVPYRHLGRELLLAAVIAVPTAIAVVAGSARFPGGA